MSPSISQVVIQNIEGGLIFKTKPNDLCSILDFPDLCSFTVQFMPRYRHHGMWLGITDGPNKLPKQKKLKGLLQLAVMEFGKPTIDLLTDKGQGSSLEALI
jgi:hypothetical protein